MTVRRLAYVIAGVVSIAHVSARGAAPPAAPPPTRGLVVAADRHDTSQALRSMPPIPRGVGPTREVPRPDRPLHVGPHAKHLNPDPVAQNYTSPSLMPASSVSFDGVPNVNAVLPPDTNGAVGPNHYVQWVNLSFAIYSKGTATTPPALLYGPAAGNTLWQGFGGPCETTNNGDPVVLYDHLADRWFMSQLAIPNLFGGITIGPYYQCIAVSATPDPTGPYYRYQYTFTKLNDYPKFAVWPDAYYMTMNQFTSVTSHWAGQGVIAFDRNQMLAGLPASMVYFDLSSVDLNLGGMLPADLDGPAPPPGSPGYFAQIDDDAWGYAPDELQIWRLHVDWANPSAATFTGPSLVPTAAFDSNLCGYARNCIPQPGTNQGVDALSDRLMYRLQYRNFGDHESLIVDHTVDVDGTDHAGLRWYEIRDPEGAPTLYQQGTYAPDADNRWSGSAAMDGAGDIALGFSVSSASTWPSVRYTGRLATDPPGVMAQGEAELVAGAGSQTSGTARWGDYSSMAVDPIDDCTFWYTQEYYSETSDASWRTRIGSFSFPSCVAAISSLPAVTIVASAPTATEAGPTAAFLAMTRSGDLGGALTVTYTVGGTATPGADYVALPGTATFAPGVSTLTIPVMAIDDLIVEPDETVVVTINAGPSYRAGVPSQAIATIVSNDAPPDLVVSALTGSGTGGAGGLITVTDTTANPGGGTAPATTTGFYLSSDGLLSSGDVLLGSRSVPALAAGGSDTHTTSLTIPADTATGIYYVIAKADDGNVVPETQEDNNTRSMILRIGPDLTMSALTAPSTAGAGGSILVSDTTTNSGGGSAAASTTAFYLSADLALTSSDPQLGSRAVPALAPGASSSGSTSLTIPSDTQAGTYYVFAKADAGGVVSEIQETNNTRFSGAIHIGPDLVVSSLIAPSTAMPGGSITVTDTTKNLGPQSAGASQTGFYLSTNAAFDASDIQIGSRNVPALASGQTSTAATSVQIPADTPTGLYYVLARADWKDQVTESVETNNVAFAAVRVGPDLAVTSLSVPAGAGAGDTVAVGDTTTNQGTGSAGASTTAFYLSTDVLFSASDIPIGSRAVPALAAGAASAATTNVQIPPGTATGTYFVLAVADATGQVAETNEINNVRFAVIRIGPDLVVSGLGVAGGATAGGTITVTDTTLNQGGGPAPTSTTQYYLSTNFALDSGDVLLGSRAVAALAGGASDTGTVSLTVPAGTAAGTYYIIAVADGPNAIVETFETNNTRAVVVQIAPAP